ncbi:MAG: reverse transcriptase/maturase family protein, partial [Candidatus Vogelbacteria bacterium]|nr:reverse transcriptase/maturase family protein [Candidatus Vogelbacteria bacterium]
GKKHKKDVAEFAHNLADNIYQLHLDLKNKTYVHGPYQAFNISDPKPRNIHKAMVRDRLLHHAIYRILYYHFNQKFIYDSYSCRLSKGTHKAVKRFENFGRKVSQNNTKTSWILKCDVRKFFASIDHETLTAILQKHEPDSDIIWLLGQVIESFHTARQGLGLPLGNLTSQLLVNIYMNEFDQFMKHELKVKYYVRYADDFVIMARDKKYLENLLPVISSFLLDNLKLNLHPDKVYIKTLASGVDFLGWVNFPNHRVLRTATKRRMFKNLAQNNRKPVTDSYLGMLGHGNAYKLSRLIDQRAII